MWYKKYIHIFIKGWGWRLAIEGGDKVPISKFWLTSGGGVFIGHKQTYLVFWTFWFGPKKTLRRPNFCFWLFLGPKIAFGSFSDRFWPSKARFFSVFNLVTTRHLPDTLRHHPDTPRHHPDTSRHHPDTPTHRGFYASEVTGRTMQYLSVMTIYDFYWIASIPDSIQSHPNALQTPSRHPPDTSQTPQNLALFGCGRKGNSFIWRLLLNRLWSIWHVNSPDIC